MDTIIGKMNKSKGPNQGFGIADHLRAPPPEDEVMEPVCETGCRSCGGIGTFHRTPEGESCTSCGAVSPSQKIVSLSHTKACALLDDPTTTADDARPDCVPIGFESAQEATARHYYEAGGSSLSARTRKRLGCCGAEGELKRQVVAKYRESIQVSTESMRSNRAVQIQLQNIFDKAGLVHEKVLEHIRRTAYETIIRSQMHVDVCKSESCDLTLHDIAAQTLAATFVRVLCEQLVHTLGQSDHPLIGAEVGKIDFLRLIDVANLSSGNQNGVAVARATQAVRLNLAARGPPQPCVAAGLMAQPVSKSDSMESLSDSPIFSVRNSVWAFTKTGCLSAELRDHCLRIVSSGSIDHWLRSVALPADVLAAVLLAVCASRMGGAEEKKADTVAETAARQNNVSVSLVKQLKTEATTSISTLFTDAHGAENMDDDGL